ncbi:AAA family ATPase [Mycolicibacterium parafortuitum]|uniref:TPR domain-containing protein [Thermodesulfovibrio yellowstonii DSM] n=1 Tax=Mycolicibacterium parafortuitum TaxID=39692 RepID=A0A375YGN0_MYCPF|nr:AAA family ATPase [Mycolicibacterium parafortuitum]ORB25873.1 AAA family ATPase [Mycolicibacterium parafortuitum]SRX80199.1 TPR domain-containing protein [Thermodesulfovibrio yellowstonii DSM] [Mycolicibacterium parafortuitum]
MPIVLTEEFREALALLEHGSHVFLTGKAGTGKSTLIRRFIADTDRNVVVVAPTGIAALNVDGYTVHRMFGFRSTTTLDDIRRGEYRPGRFAKTLAALQTLIIDEASMVRADVFDMVAAALERFGPAPGTPFGGVQIVLVGDLYQLPPVVREDEVAYFSTVYDTPYFFSAKSFRREDFPTVSLTTVFRQLGDDRMTAILNEIREGVLLGHAQEQLNARADKDFVPPDDEFWLTLAPTNRLVTARNRQQLERLPGDEMVHHAKASGDLAMFEAPVEETLRFKVGAQVMMLNNDQGNRWVNGTVGRVAGVGYDRYGAVVDVEFPDGTTAEVSPFTWEVTRPVASGASLSREVVGTYTQLPFKLAWAITIHKSQGQTLERVVVDLTGGMFSTGQLYVALSRCTSLSGLVLKRPVLPKDLKTDRRIVRYLRSSAGDAGTRRYCAIGMLTVGDEGRMSRPRPVELAVAFDDGTAVTTLVNPQRDLADARAAYGITVSDVLLAPTLREAWAVIAPMLAGCTPVGAGVDEQLGLLDFELKRLGFVTAMPIGVELRGVRVTGRTALERARAALAAHRDTGAADGSSAFDDPESAEVSGLLVSRDSSVPTPVADHLPALSALLRISRDVGAVLLGREAPAREDVTGWEGGARRSVADQLRAAAERVQLTDEVIARLRAAEDLLGVDILTGAELLVQHDVGEVLTDGARICFTGTAQDPAGRVVERDEMERLALAAGLTPVKSVTKTRCDVLVTAEAGTQSGKARKALEYGKPVLCADDFFGWLATRG